MANEIRTFSGLAVSRGRCKERYRGNAKIVLSPDDFDKVENGDVIVVFASSPAWTEALLKAGALIAEVGGVLCHTAIVAREIGVPAVVNIENITKLLKDGDLVEIDVRTGEVNVLN
jgi:pyruvate,water dikinase